MKKLIRKLSYSLALLFIILIAIISFLITTNAGLYTSVHIVNWFIPGQISVNKATGTLLSSWHLEKVRYDNPQLSAKLDVVDTNWHLFDLIKGRLTILKLEAGHLLVHYKSNASKEEQPTPTNELESPLQLPINIAITDLTLHRLTVDQTSFSNIHLMMGLDKTDWQISQLSLDASHSQLQLAGQINPTYPYSVETKLTAKALNSEGFSGELSIKGNWSDYAWQGFITSPLSFLTAGHIREGRIINGHARWREFTLPGQHRQPLRLAPGELMVNGDTDKLVFSLNTALIKPVATTIKVSGFHSPRRNKALLIVNPDNGHLTAKILQDIEQNKAKTSIKVTGNNLDLTPFHLPITQLNLKAQLFGSSLKDVIGKLTAKGNYHHTPLSLSLQKSSQRIQGTASLANNQFTIDGMNPFPITIKGSLPSPQFLAPSLEGLKTHINLSGKFNSASDGRAQLSIQPGQYSNPLEPSLPYLSFIGGKYDLILSKQGLHISGKLAIDKQKILLTKIQLPQFSLAPSSQKPQTISGKLFLNLNSLEFLTQITPYITEAKGNVKAQLNISGQLARPQLNGKIELKQGSFKTPSNEQPFQPVTATLTTTNHLWRLRGVVTHQNSQVTVSGSGQFTPKMVGQISMKGNQFLAMNSKEYQIYISPNIAINLSPDQTEITGDISVPKALISPQTFSSTVTLSDDVVFANQQDDATQSTPFKLNLLVKMGDDVHLKIEGLSAKIIGQVRLQKQSGGILTSSGQLSVADGQYDAYGQKLDISQGELLFAGGSISNPGVNVRATRTFKTTGQAFSGSNRLFDFGASNIQSMSFANVTTVGIQVSGRLSNPKVTLFSEPSNLQQSDILSMLVLGRPASQASSSGGQLLLSAITGMGLDRGTQGSQLLSQLKDKLGLEFGLNDNTTYNQQQDQVSSTHSIGVKKKFSDRLSVGYSMGIYDSNSTVLTLTYLLNKFLSIKVNASDTSNGIDLTYTRSKD